MFKLPFGSWPGHWGLKGKTREIAKAEYELSGYELEEKLLDINSEDKESKEYRTKLLNLKKKHNKITEAEFEKSNVELIDDETTKGLKLAEIEYREGKIGDLEYEKRRATLNKEPWVTVLNMDFGKKNSLEGSFELDWNQYFVEKLEAEGYKGDTADAIVNIWFMELCRNIALEEFDGTGDFTADSEANLETYKRWNTEERFSNGRKGYK